LFYDEDDLLPLSALQHLLFCERRAALVHIEGLWAENTATLEGDHLHEKVHGELPAVSRGDVRIARSLPLRSLRLGLSGKTDVVEFHRTGEVESAPVEGAPKRHVRLENVRGRWKPYPVEYKRGKLRREEGYVIQLCAQAICLEEMLECEITQGALYFGATRHRLEVEFDRSLREYTEAAAARLHEMIALGVTPRAVREPKCEKCSLLGLCLPEAMSRSKSVMAYVEKMKAEP
jgi:CRISPR-associated exonuclease Cas4